MRTWQLEEECVHAQTHRRAHLRSGPSRKILYVHAQESLVSGLAAEVPCAVQVLENVEEDRRARSVAEHDAHVPQLQLRLLRVALGFVSRGQDGGRQGKTHILFCQHTIC